MLKWLCLVSVWHWLLLCSYETMALGAQGHEAVCTIAYLELNDQARATVDRLRQSIDDYPSFGASCVWPDTRGRLQNARRESHFINILRTLPLIVFEQCPANKDCIFDAIQTDLAALKNTALSDAKRWSALKFLGHWYGDLHQPLHVSYADDRGGNLITLARSIGCDRNLHSVWDDCIVKDLITALNLAENPAALGQTVQSRINDKQRSLWRLSNSVLAIANESYTIAQRADVQYCVKVKGICQYRSNQELYSGNRYNDTNKKRVLNLADDYLNQFHDLMQQRMAQAGVRLADVLNRVLVTETNEATE